MTLPAMDQRSKIHSEVKNDETLKLVMQYVQHEWPQDKRKVCGPISKNWSERGNNTLHDGLLLRGRRINIPLKFRLDVLRPLRDGHQGVTKTQMLPLQSGSQESPLRSQRWCGTVPCARNAAENA